MTKTFPTLKLRIDGLTPGVGSVRYTLKSDIHNYTLWMGDKVESRYMLSHQMPPWLAVLVDAAKLGGHMLDTGGRGAPVVSFWCEVDVGRNLIRFVDRSKFYVS